MSKEATRFRHWGVLLSVCSAIAVAVSRPALSSGAFIHLAAAEKARGHLKKALEANLSGQYKEWYFAGAAFPDAMGQVKDPKKAGSWAHFGRFLGDAAQLISENCSGIGASYAGATCKELLAFHLGVLSHVTVDWRFDSSFVTNTKDQCSVFKGKSLSKEVQAFTDTDLDAVAVCKHRDYYAKDVIGKDRKFNISYPTKFILLVARMEKSPVQNLSENDVKTGYRKWLDGAIGNENKLVSAGIFCETALATGGATGRNPWNTCKWATDESNYWEDKGTRGSVADLSRDVLPETLNLTYDRFVASLGKKDEAPTFVSNRKDWPDERLCLKWIPENAAKCDK